MEIRIRDNDFQLLPQKAMYWKQERMLIISDVHIGKITHFRREGIYLPQSAVKNNFERLDEIFSCLDIRTVVFTGDLFHADYNEEWAMFARWRHSLPGVRMILVSGNHDYSAKVFVSENNIEYYPEYFSMGDFQFAHFPVHSHSHSHSPSSAFLICGHIHPVFCLQGRGQQNMRLPCFFISPHQCILPGFGYFTGGFEMKPGAHDAVYVIAGESIFSI